MRGSTVAGSSLTYARAADGGMDVSAASEENDSGTVTVSAADGSFADLAFEIRWTDFTDTYYGGVCSGEALYVTASPRTNAMMAGWRIDGSCAQSHNKTHMVHYAGSGTAKTVKAVTQSMFNNTVSFETAYEGGQTTPGGAAITAGADETGFASGTSVGAGKELTFTFSGSGVPRCTITCEGCEETDILNEYGAPVVGNPLKLPYAENNAAVKT